MVRLFDVKRQLPTMMNLFVYQYPPAVAQSSDPPGLAKQLPPALHFPPWVELLKQLACAVLRLTISLILEFCKENDFFTLSAKPAVSARPAINNFFFMFFSLRLLI